MNIFNFAGNGGSGGGGSAGLLQPMKVVDSSHNEQLIQADVPYTGLGSVLIQAPNMANPVFDSSCNTITYYTPEEDLEGNPYFAMDSVTINAPVMETRTIDASYGPLTIIRDTENYVGLEQVNINAPVMKSITINPSQDSSTVYNIVSEGDVAAGYVGLEQVTVPVVTAAIDSNIIPENIMLGVTILGVTGIYSQDFKYTELYNRLVTI